MYDWVQEEIQKELNKPNQFYPDWDMIKPFHDRIAELEIKLAKPWVGLTDVECIKLIDEIQISSGDYELLIARAIESNLKEKNT